MMKRFLAGACAASFVATAAFAQDRALSADDAKALEIFRTIITYRTAEGHERVPAMAAYLAGELRKAGFSKKDVEIRKSGETASLVVRYRGDRSSGKKPILFLAHMDVVDALPEDWELDPFTLTEKDGFFFGRGVSDNKYGVMNLTQTFIRLKTKGYVPNRDLIIVFTGDEESNMLTTRALAADGELASAEFALNTDAGGGSMGDGGKPLVYAVQAAEKTYVDFTLTATNEGGHSSRPRPDNAIYDLSAALEKVEALKFPVMSNAITRQSFAVTGNGLGGDLGRAMISFAKNPRNRRAAERISADPSYVGLVRTTCVATMLKAGHAPNALPQTASANINCRIFPGMSVDDVKTALGKAIANERIAIKVDGDPTVSPISEPREDVLAAITKAVHARYPGTPIVTYMESGGTDGMHFRIAGVPTFGASAMFMREADGYAHGLNERIPVDGFFGGLEHWSIIIKSLAGEGSASADAAK
jgi:acetylornithine deacetylase/succinyl-diaminopimelate desuccinylase-like protein